MKENVKNNIIIVLIVIIILLIIGLIVICGKRETKPVSSLKANEIANIKESSNSIPDFVLVVTGSYNGSITDEDLKEKNIKLYDFDAGLENFWGVDTVHLTGVKLKDVLDAMQIKNYKEIVFNGTSYRSVTFEEDQITDNAYLVFYNDGKLFDSDTTVSFIAPDYKYKYSIEGITSLGFISEYDSDEKDE